ncbi:MAG: 5-methyltetrahydropteroyltriglutamate--homocysteine methyltransferase [Chromatiales bacterium]|jgi:5-methyltetrahydropteroyltriglutamate--homocysteine methyltransferase|nr:5-methyltetrahydropteroyltriglutamate--homocysteine methyltransferase [Chromatiales bacterium]MDP6150711.1 methionine synthase [Gammaproteobacteria bacterium]MDP7094388.1 methionine synthase [Gammaproteobacteria bacterium]MDP7271565.1 methionine synthase [Gammaproteobacteria bacterium]HJP05527.1 methionine synthase [Gammaproteobacteria bacterium]
MFATTIAGSLPRPDWLAEPEILKGGWKLEGEELEAGKKRACEEWIRHQEAAGIDILTDGEVFRTHFVHSFLKKIEGIDQSKKTLMGIRDNRYDLEVPTVTGPVSRPAPVFLDDFKFTRSLTDKQLKITLPGPMTICDTIADDHYGSRPDMAMAFAELLNDEAKELEAAGADVVQFDEPAFNVFMDDVREWGIDTLNRAVQGLKCTKAVHICYGYGIEENIQWKETLGEEWRQYDEIFPSLNKSHVDQVSLECASSHVPLSVMSHLSDKQIMVGAVAVTADRVETPEEVAATINEATRYVDPERILPCTNCGMTPIAYDIALAKLYALTAGAKIARKAL